MTPAEHRAEAERLLVAVRVSVDTHEPGDVLLAAIAHALLAQAPEPVTAQRTPEPEPEAPVLYVDKDGIGWAVVGGTAYAMWDRLTVVPLPDAERLYGPLTPWAPVVSAWVAALRTELERVATPEPGATS